MTEVVLNLLWLLIAVAGIAGWTRTRHRLVENRRRQLLCEIFALGMALAILWIPISVTDNLHPGLFQAEDAGNTKRVAKSCDQAHAADLHGSAPPPPALLPSAYSVPTLALVCLLALYPAAPSPVTRLSQPSSNRSPPSL